MKQFRFIIHGRYGAWRDYTLSAFLSDCEAWAENGVDFQAEFRS